MLNKTLGFALAAGLTCAGSAFAADLPVREPAPAYAPPVFTWTGFYVGVNAGGAFAESRVRRTPSSLWLTSGLPADIANSNAFSTIGRRSLHPSGFTGGLTVGYNFQSGSIVFGIEGDINYMGLRSSSVVGPFAVAGGNPQTYLQSIRTSYLATLRPRIGVAFDRALFYVTGGLAVADSRFSGGTVFNAGLPSYLGSTSKTQVGWTVGGGVEYAFTNNWTTKLEYLYADLGRSNFVGAGAGAVAGYTIGHSQRLTTQIVRAGLNYKF